MVLVVAQAFSGGISGTLTAIVTNPMDIVRTKAQVYTQYGAIDTLKYILRRDGVRGLMTGVNAVGSYLNSSHLNCRVD